MALKSYNLGIQGEDIATDYLGNRGYKILERNFHSHQGEIDIVAMEGQTLVFIEVKNYSFKSYVHPLGAITKAKKESIIHAARTYLFKNNIKDKFCRFDVLAIFNFERFNLIKGAFDVG